MQCGHWDGYRKPREEKMACRICGKTKGTDEHWLVLPRKGRKRIGSYATPTSRKVFATEKQAPMRAATGACADLAPSQCVRGRKIGAIRGQDRGAGLTHSFHNRRSHKPLWLRHEEPGWAAGLLCPAQVWARAGAQD